MDDPGNVHIIIGQIVIELQTSADKVVPEPGIEPLKITVKLRQRDVIKGGIVKNAERRWKFQVPPPFLPGAGNGEDVFREGRYRAVP